MIYMNFVDTLRILLEQYDEARKPSKDADRIAGDIELYAKKLVRSVGKFVLSSLDCG